MVENVKLRQIIGFLLKDNVLENLTSGCHGKAFLRVLSTSINIAKITLLVSKETWSHDSSDKIFKVKRGTF